MEAFLPFGRLQSVKLLRDKGGGDAVRALFDIRIGSHTLLMLSMLVFAPSSLSDFF